MVDNNKLIKYRELNNDTQKTLANKLKVRKKLVVEWETGITEIDENNLNKFIKLYNLEMKDLIKKKSNVLWYFLGVITSIFVSIIINTIYTDLCVLITNIICLSIIFIFVVNIKDGINKEPAIAKSLFNIKLDDKLSKRLKLYLKESIVIGSLYIILVNIFKVLELEILVINIYLLPIRSVNDLVISGITYLLITFITFIIELGFGEYIYKKGA